MLQLGQIWYQDNGEKNLKIIMWCTETWPVAWSTGGQSLFLPVMDSVPLEHQLACLWFSWAQQSRAARTTAPWQNTETSFLCWDLQSKGCICEQSAASSAFMLWCHWCLVHQAFPWKHHLHRHCSGSAGLGRGGDTLEICSFCPRFPECV